MVEMTALAADGTGIEMGEDGPEGFLRSLIVASIEMEQARLIGDDRECVLVAEDETSCVVVDVGFSGLKFLARLRQAHVEFGLDLIYQAFCRLHGSSLHWRTSRLSAV
jgi:hypothetical protein